MKEFDAIIPEIRKRAEAVGYEVTVYDHVFEISLKPRMFFTGKYVQPKEFFAPDLDIMTTTNKEKDGKLVMFFKTGIKFPYIFSGFSNNPEYVEMLLREWYETVGPFLTWLHSLRIDLE